jgi:hypothetical protein
MRTTLDVEDDVMFAVKEIARRRRLSLGKVLSDLARQALVRSGNNEVRNGVPLFPVQPGAGVVTPELMRRLEDEMP